MRDWLFFSASVTLHEDGSSVSHRALCVCATEARLRATIITATIMTTITMTGFAQQLQLQKGQSGRGSSPKEDKLCNGELFHL